jgi:hypothetical protein
MEKVMNYVTGFFGGLVSIIMAFVPVTILWTLLTGNLVFVMDIIGNFIAMINALGNAGFVGLLSLVFIMYFFVDCKKECAKK